jgi:hypothetical protein
VEEDSLPGSENLRVEILDYFETHFGVAREALASLVFQEKNKEIWAASGLLPPGIASTRPPGLRILRRPPIGLKPTSAFLQLLGDRIATSRVEITEIEPLRRLLLGQAISISQPDGLVALSFRRDVLGCGEVRKRKLKALIPVARRKALLDVLLTEEPPPV